MSLQQLLRPRSIAVVGATSSSFVGGVALRNCLALGYSGTLTPIHPTKDSVEGLDAVPGVGQLPERPDLVVVQVAATRALDVVHDALAAGVTSFVVPGGGATDSGELAGHLSAELWALRKRGVRVVGPNCMGVVDLVTGAAPYIGTVPAEHLRRGSVAVLAQSGAVAELVVNAGGRVPLSTVVSTGAEATTKLADYLDFFAKDPETRSALVFLEAVDNGQHLLAAVRRFVAGGKQLAVLMVGRSSTSREGIAAHSGKLAGSHRVATAALAQAGALLADDLDELLCFGEIFGSERSFGGNRVFAVTNSGGEGNLIADLAEDAGLVLPPAGARLTQELRHKWPSFHVRNPLDPWGVDDYETVFPAAISAAVECGPETDIVVVSQDQQRTSGDHEQQLGLDLATYLAASAQARPFVPVLLSPTSQDPSPQITQFCRANAIVHLRGARPALSVLGKIANAVVAPLRRQADALVSDTVAGLVIGPVISDVDALTEDDALALLDALGVRTPARHVVKSPEEAVAAAAQLTGPVVLKGMAPALWHKTELGLVRLGLSSPQAVLDAAREVLETGRAAGLDLTLVVSETVRASLEVYVGYQRDPQFSHTVIVGLGGIWTEVLDTVDVHVGLLDHTAALDWLPRTQLGAIMARSREGGLDLDGVAAAVAAVSRLAATNDLSAIDVNPLLVSAVAATAVDATIHRSSSTTTERREP